MPSFERHPVLAHGAALLAVTIAFAAALLLEPHLAGQTSLWPLLVATVLAAWWGGATAGLLALAVGGVGAAYFLLEPRNSFALTYPAQISLTLFILTCLLLVALVASALEGHRRATARERLLAATFDSIADGVVTTNSAGRITRMNGSAERLTGWRVAEARNRPLTEVLQITAVNRPGPALPPLESLLPGGGLASNQRCMLIRSDGSERPIAHSVASVAPPDGDGGRVYVLRDISEWRRTEADLRRIAAELWATNQRKEECFGLLAAELRRAPTADDNAPAVRRINAARVIDVAREDDAEPITQPVDEFDGPSATSHRLLMVGDDTDSAYALTMLLGMAGYDVRTAATQEAAIHELGRFDPAVAVIDMSTPTLDGLATCRDLRRAAPGLDVVALGGDAQRRELGGAGFTAQVPKGDPFALKRWLREQRAAAPVRHAEAV